MKPRPSQTGRKGWGRAQKDARWPEAGGEPHRLGGPRPLPEAGNQREDQRLATLCPPPPGLGRGPPAPPQSLWASGAPGRGLARTLKSSLSRARPLVAAFRAWPSSARPMALSVCRWRSCMASWASASSCC